MFPQSSWFYEKQLQFDARTKACLLKDYSFLPYGLGPHLVSSTDGAPISFDEMHFLTPQTVLKVRQGQWI